MNFDDYTPPAAAVVRSSPGPDERARIRWAVDEGKSEAEVVALLPEVDPESVKLTYLEFKPAPVKPVVAAKKKSDPLE